MYAHRSTPSFSKVILRLFAVVSLIFLAYFSYSTFAEHDPLKERLYELGYPTEGFIFSNNTIRWADGHLTIVQGPMLRTIRSQPSRRTRSLGSI